ncbi:MAG TPA: glycosyltransferase family 4 protein [Anaerolineae bacterium]|nr:glycosyltransferase family 4 protein [Anaerolineae bacterium]
MKIALISPYDFPYPGGVTEHIIALAKGARQRGHEVHILAACSGYWGEISPDIKAVTRRVMSVPIAGAIARVGLSPSGYVRAKRILQREAFDVIHLHEPLTPSVTWWVLLYARKLPQTVTIGTFHAYHERPHWLYAHSRPIFAQLFSRLDSLIAVSGAAYDFAYHMFPGDYRIIPNGIDLDRFGPGSRITACPSQNDQRTLTILFVGRLDKRKGFLNLLAAFIKLKADYPHLRLQVVGPFIAQEAESYQKMARAYHVTDIEFVGYVLPDRLPDFYHQADIFCAPSIGFESFGIVLLEAMAAGLPIVASDIAGYRTLLTDGQEGWLTPPGQPEALAGALRQLIDNPNQRREMGQQGRIKAADYSWDHIVDKILDVYRDTIECKMKARRKNLSHAESGLASPYATSN